MLLLRNRVCACYTKSALGTGVHRLLLPRPVVSQGAPLQGRSKWTVIWAPCWVGQMSAGEKVCYPQMGVLKRSLRGVKWRWPKRALNSQPRQLILRKPHGSSAMGWGDHSAPVVIWSHLSYMNISRYTCLWHLAPMGWYRMSVVRALEQKCLYRDRGPDHKEEKRGEGRGGKGKWEEGRGEEKRGTQCNFKFTATLLAHPHNCWEYGCVVAKLLPQFLGEMIFLKNSENWAKSRIHRPQPKC